MNKLRPHQEKVVREAPNKHGLWMRPRTGKTPTGITLASTKVKSCLVIVPKHIKEQWQKEIDKWNNTDCQFTVTTKERFRIDRIDSVKKRGRGKTLIFGDKIPKYDAVIVDEVHRQASNPKSMFFKSLDSYIKTNNIEYVWLLSGTPWNKNPWSVYSYGKLLGKDWNFFEWRSYFFIRIQHGPREFYKPDEKKFPELIRLLNNLGTTVRLEDITDVGEDYEEEEYFDLNAEQKQHIKAITDTTPLARNTKIHQLESGTLKSDGYSETLKIECEKDKRILELAEEEDKLIIVCRYLNQIDKYQNMLMKAGYKVFTISGQMEETLEYVRSRAETLDKCIVIIQSEKSDGYDLKSFSTMVFASMSYSFISYDQMKNRMKSMEKTEPCRYIYLLTRGKSVDKAVYDSVKRGEDFSDKLFNK